MSIQLPTPRLPKPLDLPVIHLKEPSARFPSYRPMVIPPADLEAPEEVEKEEKTEEKPEPPKLKIPVIDIQMPLPETAVVVTAVTTAVIAVTTTTITHLYLNQLRKRFKNNFNLELMHGRKSGRKKSPPQAERCSGG